MKLTERNELVNNRNELKKELITANLMKAIEIKDKILSIEIKLGTATLFNGEIGDECENCGS